MCSVQRKNPVKVVERELRDLEVEAVSYYRGLKRSGGSEFQSKHLAYRDVLNSIYRLEFRCG